MLAETIERFNSSGAWEFAKAITALAERCENLERENSELKKIKGKCTDKIIVVKGDEVIEFKTIRQAAKFLNIYTWEAEDLLMTGDEYNGYTLDEVKE